MKKVLELSAVQILSYEMPWSNFSFFQTCLSFLKNDTLVKKLEMLKLYKTQAFRQYNNEEYFKSLMKIKGFQINEKYAESFQILRWKIY